MFNSVLLVTINNDFYFRDPLGGVAWCTDLFCVFGVDGEGGGKVVEWGCVTLALLAHFADFFVDGVTAG